MPPKLDSNNSSFIFRNIPRKKLCKRAKKESIEKESPIVSSTQTLQTYIQTAQHTVQPNTFQPTTKLDKK